MTQKITKTAFLLISLSCASVLYSCKNDDNESGNNSYGDVLYMGSTYNLVDNYFTPKKLNVCSTSQKNILVDWFANEYIGSDDKERDDTRDINQEYSERYYFTTWELASKYAATAYSSDGRFEVMFDENDIISPYKEYASFYGDTLCKAQHCASGKFYHLNACVLPVKGIDILCDKDFDEAHPAGTSLNDIVKMPSIYNTYGVLNKKDENGKPLYYGKTDYDFYDDANLYLENIFLNTIPDNPIQMLSSNCLFSFDREPSAHGVYEFTIKFTFGADPLTGKTVDIAPATVSIEF